MNKFSKIILLIAATYIACPAALAQETPLSSQKDPIEITAEQSLEWKRNEKVFIARQNAKATQGDVSISAQTLTAHYRDQNGSGMEIYEMHAENDVVITSNQSKAFGQKAEYYVDEGKAVMIGDNLRMTSPDQNITARDRFEYWTNDGRVLAIGDATITRPKPDGGKDTLRADKIAALLTENANGERVLHSMEAIGNVVITTPTEVLTGAYGIYKADTNKAEVTGDVVIKRGPNILEGKKAEVDLTTNVSRMFGDEKTGGQVRGIFYPNSN
ncbi:MAG: LptA/OstA family protein [Pseudomonadota bacterium]